MKTAVIINPLSGSYSTALEQSIQLSFRDASLFHIEPSQTFGDKISQLIAQGYTRFFVAGGDGSVASAAYPLMGTPYQLGIIPVGTANIIATELGFPSVRKTIEQYTKQEYHVMHTDAIVLDDHKRCALLNVSAGMSANAIASITRHDKRRWGKIIYLLSAGFQMFGLRKRYRFIVSVDNKRTRILKAADIIQLNAGLALPSFANRIAQVTPTDGKTVVLIIKARSLLHFFRVGLGLLFNHPYHRYERVIVRTRLTIDAMKPVPVQADGDIIGTTPVRIHVRPASLCMMVPNSL